MSENQNHLRYTTRQKDTDMFVNKLCESASLYLSKFPFIPSPGNWNRNQKREIEQKKHNELKRFCSQLNSNKDKIKSVKLPQIPGAVSFTAVNKGRLLVNHTGGLIENTNLALHRFFNCPIIPGSAVKGIARNVGRCDEDQDRFARVFGEAEGKKNQTGSVAFLMAIPENNNWKVVPDVLTSHHGSDTQNPTPVFFPAVEAGATFRFTIAPTSRVKDGDLEFAVKCLKTALSENGVGAKSAAGYGWFEVSQKVECYKLLTPSDEVAAYSYLNLGEKLDEIIASNNLPKQRAYIERMIKEKMSLLNKWSKKNNPALPKFKALAEKCGVDLPL